jgi:hypothetical protein
LSPHPDQPNPIARDDLETFETADGLIIYDPELDRTHHLNPSASVIFLLCNGDIDQAAMADHLAGAFRLDSPPADEVATCLDTLRNEGLLR